MAKILVVIDWYQMPIAIDRCIDIDWYRLVADQWNQSNITSLYAVIVNALHFNSLNVNRLTIFSSFSSTPPPQVFVFL